MTRLLAALLAALLVTSLAYAGAGTITTKDAGGVTRTFDVVTDGSGNYNPTAVVCDQSAAATCASVGTAGSPSTNALTIQAVTLGHGTAANAARVELPTDGTGQIATVSTVTTVSTVSASRTVGNGGAVMDFAGQNASAPANALQMGCQFNTSPTTITSGNASPCQLDNAGNLLVNIKSATGLAQGSTTSGQTGSLVMGAVTTAAPSYTTAQTSPTSLDLAGDLRVASIGQSNITPTDCSGTISSGGTAQNAIAAQTAMHGFTIANIDSTSGSGEPLWVSFTTTAAASTAASYPLPPPTATSFAAFGSFTTPVGFGSNVAVSIIAATTGHKYSCTRW